MPESMTATKTPFPNKLYGLDCIGLMQEAVRPSFTSRKSLLAFR